VDGGADEGSRPIGSWATSGIGREAARKLAADGFSVLVHGRDGRRGAAVVQEITEAGGRARFVSADLTDIDAIGRLAELAGDAEVLVNNAGLSWFGPTADLEPASFDKLFAANVRSAYYLVAAIAPAMAKRGSGSILRTAPPLPAAADRAPLHSW
jgi:NAD(P)-dependent dehydrogenase (short-subunit alcohol dehydrogenase family)